MSSSKAARLGRTEAVKPEEAVSPTASLKVGTLISLKNEHEALVTIDGSNVAATLLQSARTDIAAQGLRAPFPVLIGRTSGSRTQYIVISPAALQTDVLASPGHRDKLLLSAESSIELRCGDSLITLAKDGKITIRGVDVHSRAARACKIKGGTVSIN